MGSWWLSGPLPGCQSALQLFTLSKMGGRWGSIQSIVCSYSSNCSRGNPFYLKVVGRLYQWVNHEERNRNFEALYFGKWKPKITRVSNPPQDPSILTDLFHCHSRQRSIPFVNSRLNSDSWWVVEHKTSKKTTTKNTRKRPPPKKNCLNQIQTMK